MKKIGIYKIVNPTGKVYIGQSLDVEKRMLHYKKLQCKDQQLLYNSILKYGFNSHKISIVVVCDAEQLNDLERFYIKKFKSNVRKHGLNLTSGGRDYFYHCESVKKKMSIAQLGNTKRRGKKQPQEEVAKRVKQLIGKKRSVQQKTNISKSLIGRKLSQQHRDNMSKSFQYKNAKKIINIETLEIYNRCQDAASSIGMKRTTLIAMLNGQNKNKSPFKYV